jgi:hypothetical protein
MYGQDAGRIGLDAKESAKKQYNPAQQYVLCRSAFVSCDVADKGMRAVQEIFSNAKMPDMVNELGLARDGVHLAKDTLEPLVQEMKERAMKPWETLEANQNGAEASINAGAPVDSVPIESAAPQVSAAESTYVSSNLELNRPLIRHININIVHFWIPRKSHQLNLSR